VDRPGPPGRHVLRPGAAAQLSLPVIGFAVTIWLVQASGPPWMADGNPSWLAIASPPGGPTRITVLALMAEGRSNAGIAAALVFTLGTVEKHVASIFGKLGLPACQTDNRRVLAVLRYLRS
jgi:hypothetical protein